MGTASACPAELQNLFFGMQRWGDALEFVAEAGPGDFIFVPAFVPHQEINADPGQPLECVLVRSGQEAVVVNLEIESVEKPEEVKWMDAIHKG